MIADLKPYPEYKESGLPWLGQVPGHWEVKRAKSIFQRIDERSETGKEELLTVSSARGIVPRKTANVTMFKAESYLGYKLCWPGDLVINSLWAWAGGLGVSRHHGIVSSAYGVYRLRKDAPMIPSFVHEVVRSSSFNWELQVRSKGVWISRLQLTDVSFLDAPMHIPLPAEQAAIVRFLDWANGRLERAIRAKRKVIALLNEQKQAIIHRAVTRGLDPSVPSKPSGILWLGDIPQHWEVMRLKRLGEVKIGLTYSPGEMVDETGTLVLRASNVRNSVIVSADNVYVSKKVPENLLVREGDILICVRSGSRNLVGKSALITSEVAGVTYGAFMSLLRSKDNEFIFWVLNSNLFSCVMAQFETSTINQLTQSDLKNLFIPVPPATEQAEIVTYLKSATSDIHAAISRLEREIELLREYRTRLVADVVTGTLDVRDAAARLPEEATPDTAEDAAELSDETEPADEEAAA